MTRRPGKSVRGLSPRYYGRWGEGGGRKSFRRFAESHQSRVVKRLSSAAGADRPSQSASGKDGESKKLGVGGDGAKTSPDNHRY